MVLHVSQLYHQLSQVNSMKWARVGVFTPQKLAHYVNHPQPQLLNIYLHTTVLKGRIPFSMIRLKALHFLPVVSSGLCNNEHPYLRMFESFFLKASKEEVQKVEAQLLIRRVYENAPGFSYLCKGILLRTCGFK